MPPTPQISLVNRITPVLPMIQMHRRLFGIINFFQEAGGLPEEKPPIPAM
jgi:hypothetical protein